MEEKTLNDYLKETAGKLRDEMDVVSEVKNVVADLKKEADFYISVLDGLGNSNKKRKKELEEKDISYYYNPFCGTHGSKDKVRFKRMIEITETKLRRLRSKL